MADEILSCEKMVGDAGDYYCFCFRLDVTPAPVDHCICVYAKEMGDPTGKTAEELAAEAKALALPRASAIKALLQATPMAPEDVPSVVGQVTL